jgi:proteasome lid subunit RPN8/RPN11
MKRNLVAIVGAAAIATCCSQPAPQTSAPTPTQREVILAPIVKNNLDFMYETITRKAGVEYAACLAGAVTPADGTVVINRTIVPEVTYATRDSILFSCPPGSDILGYAHSHPVGSPCYHSEADSSLFAERKSALVSLVMCDSGQARVYTR